LRAERTLVDRRLRIALDIDDPPVFDVDLLATADRTVGTDGRYGLVRVADAWLLLDRFPGHGLRRHPQPAEHARSESALAFDGHPRLPNCGRILESQYMDTPTRPFRARGEGGCDVHLLRGFSGRFQPSALA